MQRGLVLGKFYPYHEGHAHLIRSARAQVDELTVLVCSISRETISGTERHAWVQESNANCRVVHVAEDVPQTPEDDVQFWPTWVEIIKRYAGRVDTVFTSELYGDELARRIGARHICVDLARTRVPVSGTAIRSNPLAHWDFLPAIVRPYFVDRIALLGAESTGKTTLAKALAEYFHTAWVPEFAREYCEGKDSRTLVLADFDAIGIGQAIAEDAAATQANRVLFCDTDLLTTCTWSDLIVGSRPALLVESTQRRAYRHVFLLAPNVPWIDDGTRVLEHQREEHTALLRTGLEQAGQAYTMLSGSYSARFAEACRIVSQIVARHATTHTLLP